MVKRDAVRQSARDRKTRAKIAEQIASTEAITHKEKTMVSAELLMVRSAVAMGRFSKWQYKVHHPLQRGPDGASEPR
jgi:hypothetical protein